MESVLRHNIGMLFQQFPKNLSVLILALKLRFFGNWLNLSLRAKNSKFILYIYAYHYTTNNIHNSPITTRLNVSTSSRITLLDIN